MLVNKIGAAKNLLIFAQLFFISKFCRLEKLCIQRSDDYLQKFFLIIFVEN
jgi:hypothetical protein